MLKWYLDRISQNQIIVFLFKPMYGKTYAYLKAVDKYLKIIY